MATVESSVSIKPSRRQRIREGLSILWQSKVAVVGLIMVLFWVLAAIFAPVITRYDPNAEDAQARNQGPSAEHWLGTDHKGRDLWSRVAYGGQIVLVKWPITESFWIPGGVAIWGVLIALAGTRPEDCLSLSRRLSWPPRVIHLTDPAQGTTPRCHEKAHWQPLEAARA